MCVDTGISLVLVIHKIEDTFTMKPERESCLQKLFKKIN